MLPPSPPSRPATAPGLLLFKAGQPGGWPALKSTQLRPARTGRHTGVPAWWSTTVT
jgi:hypothetical protein